MWVAAPAPQAGGKLGKRCGQGGGILQRGGGDITRALGRENCATAGPQHLGGERAER